MIQTWEKIYFCGIGGIGVSALAKFFLARGAAVSGSDRVESEITAELVARGVKVFYEQLAENLTAEFDLFIYSAAVPASHPERRRASELNIPQKSYFEALSMVTEEQSLLAVSGTNGKSTSTAMLADIFMAAGADPTVIVGSKSVSLDGNFRHGESNLFVLEACEYRAHMLLLSPRTILLTNIEADHLDYYRDLNHIVATFQQYVSKLKNRDDLLIINHDDANIRRLTLPACRVFSFGLVHGADVYAEKLRKEPGRQLFEVSFRGQSLGEFELRVPGDFNIYNALGAIATALAYDIPVGVIRRALAEFRGIWRRFEIIKRDPYLLISDYGHHPTAVAGTLRAAREFFLGKKIILVFQPHQKDRTRKLFDAFAEAFKNCDELILPEIYDVAGREEVADKTSSRDFLSVMKQLTPTLPVTYAADLAATADAIASADKTDAVVLLMGAGDIYLLADKV